MTVYKVSEAASFTETKRSYCERPAASTCGCSFPLPLLCEGHLTDHSDHGHLPLSASRWVRDQQTQIQLKDKLAVLSRLYESLKLYRTNEQQIAPNIRERLMEFDRNVKELASIVKCLEVHEDESNEQIDSFCSLIWDFPEGELGTWVSIGRGLSLQAEYKYEESCRVLESRWRQWSEGVEALVLGLALGEVMGLHIGRFREALAVLDRSLQRAIQLLPLSETALQITNVKIAVFIHMMEPLKVVELCKKTIQSFSEEGVNEVTYGTTLYFFMIGTIFGGISLEYEILIRKWVAKTEWLSNTQIQLLRLCIIAILKCHEYDYLGAESNIKEAEELAKVRFPNSHFAALCSYSRDYIERCLNHLRSAYLYREEDPCLRTHFPASLLRADILFKNAYAIGYMEDMERVWELQIQAIPILKGNVYSIIFLSGLCSLGIALTQTNQKKAALDLYYFAIRSVIADNECDYPANEIFEAFSDFLRTHMPERLVPAFTELMNEAQTICPERILFAQILEYTEYLETLEEKYLFLRKHYPNSDSYQQTLEYLGKLYYNSDMHEKCMETYLEGIQLIKAHRDCESYAQIISSFVKQCKNCAKEIKLEMLLEAHRYLIAMNSRESWTNFTLLVKCYKDQPDTILSLNLEIHPVLQLTPTCEEYNESLMKLTSLYKDKNQLESAIRLRLEAYQVLLAHLDCRNFIENVDGLAECYEAMGHNEVADELRLKVRQLVLAGPSIYLLQRNLVSLSKFGHQNLSYSEALLELYHLQDVNQETSSDYERIYCENSDVISMIRLLLKCLELGKTLSQNITEVVKTIGDLYLRLGEREVAIQLYVQTLHFLLERHSFCRTSTILHYLDEIFEKMGQPDRAIGVRELALCVYEKYEIVENCHNILKDLVLLHEKSGKRDKQITTALKILHFCLPILYYPHKTIGALEDTVRLFRRLGEVGRAEPLCTLLAHYHWAPKWKDQACKKAITELRLLYSRGI